MQLELMHESIDDALGFADPERLSRMATVFSTVGHDGQVIVLTCTRSPSSSFTWKP